MDVVTASLQRLAAADAQVAQLQVEVAALAARFTQADQARFTQADQATYEPAMVNLCTLLASDSLEPPIKFLKFDTLILKLPSLL